MERIIYCTRCGCNIPGAIRQRSVIYCKECRRKVDVEITKRYNQTDKGKLNIKKTNQREKGKQLRREHQKTYSPIYGKTPKRQEYLKKRNQKGKHKRRAKMILAKIIYPLLIFKLK